MNDETKQRIAQLKALHQTIESMHEHVQMLEKQRSELEYVDKSIGDLKALSSGTPILVQLSSGIFVRATMSDTNRLCVNVGADVVVEKDIAQTRTIVQNQVGQLVQVHGQMVAKLSELAEQFNELRTELQEHVQISKG